MKTKVEVIVLILTVIINSQRHKIQAIETEGTQITDRSEDFLMRMPKKFAMNQINLQRLLKKLDFPSMKFSWYFMGYEKAEDIPKDETERTRWVFTRKATVELTHNWGTENDSQLTYHNGNSKPKGFGHIGINVPDVYVACERFEKMGVNFIKRPDEGIDHCSSQPCLHGGTCVNNVTDFTCVCPTVWSGKRCEKGSIASPQGCSKIQYTDCECTIASKRHNSARTIANKSNTGRSVLASSIGVISGLATSVVGYLSLLYCLKKCNNGPSSNLGPSKGAWSRRSSAVPTHKPIPTNVYQNSGQSGYRNVYRFTNATYGSGGPPDNIKMSYTDATHDW